MHLMSQEEAQSLFYHGIVSQHLLHCNTPWRERERHPNICQRKKTGSKSDPLWDWTIIHAWLASPITFQYSFLCALLILGSAMDVVEASGCWLDLRKSAMFVQSRLQMDCFLFLLLPPVTPHPWKTPRLLRYLGTLTQSGTRSSRDWLFTSMAAKTPEPPLTLVGVCHGSGKHDKTGRKNVSLVT